MGDEIKLNERIIGNCQKPSYDMDVIKNISKDITGKT